MVAKFMQLYELPYTLYNIHSYFKYVCCTYIIIKKMQVTRTYASEYSWIS